MLKGKLLGATAAAEAAGQTLFIGKTDELGGPTVRTHSFVVPDGVTEISAVCVGPGQSGRRNDSSAPGGSGGNLRYSSSIAVTPGETLTVEVGDGIAPTTFQAYGGATRILRGATVLLQAANRANTVENSTIGGLIGGGDGGLGGSASSTYSGGGGGAGGYSGNGGQGQDGSGTSYSPDANSGAAFGGTRSTSTGNSSGGVGLMGLGPTASEAYSSQNGRNAVGSYGFLNPYTSGYNPGFGSGGSGNDGTSGTAQGGGPGACRIVWGLGRSYPSDVDNYLPVPAAASQIEVRIYGAVGFTRLSMIEMRDSGNTNFFSGLTAVTGDSTSSFSSISAGQFTLKSWQTITDTELALLKTTGRTSNTAVYPTNYLTTGLDPADYHSLFVKLSSAVVLKSITLTSAYTGQEYRDPVAGIAVIADGVNITKGIACLRGDYVWDGTYETLVQTITFT